MGLQIGQQNENFILNKKIDLQHSTNFKLLSPT
jgi:hypothetical protein